MKTNSNNTLEDKKDRFTPGEWIASHFMNESSIYCPSQKKGIAKLRNEWFDYPEEEIQANADHIVKCVNAFPELVAALEETLGELRYALAAHNSILKQNGAIGANVEKNSVIQKAKLALTKAKS